MIKCNCPVVKCKNLYCKMQYDKIQKSGCKMQKSLLYYNAKIKLNNNLRHGICFSIMSYISQ